MMTEEPKNNDPAEGVDLDALSDGDIINSWLTTRQVADMHSMTRRAVLDACRDGRLIAKQISMLDNRWFVEPTSAKNFKKGNTGPRKN